MPKRLAFSLILQLLLCTSAFAQSPNVTATATETTLWDHNGSVMYLIANGLSRQFYYKKPRPGMLEAGAHADSLLFRGQIKDGQFSGTAYIFNLHCGQVPFDVKGPILDNNEMVVLTGQAPRVGRNCQTYGYYTSNLEFKLLKTTDVAQSAAPAITTQAPTVEESKPKVPSSGAGEPKPSAQQPTTAQTPSIEQPKPDVPAREVGEPKQPGNPSSLPSMTDQVPIAAQDSGDQKRLAPLLMAMIVLLPVLSILFLIGILKWKR
jgi:hypothetical protein